MSKMQTELMAATEVAGPKKGEARDAFLKRLYSGVDALEDGDFTAMSKGAQDWANKASKAYNADKPIPELSDFEPETSAEEANMNTKTTKIKAEKAPAEKPAPKAPAKEKKAAEPKAKGESKRGSGVGEAILSHVLKAPKDTAEDISAALKAKGVEASDATIGGMRSSFIRDIRFLAKKGLLTKDILGEAD